jgi:serine/threonine protein kinase
VTLPLNRRTLPTDEAPMAYTSHAAGWTEDTAADSVLDDAYRLTRTICEGAMGTVYEAMQLRLQKRVALKIMVPELAQNPEALARFRREVEVTSKLAHPHVIQLLDFGTTPTGQPYLVMEYLQGEDLESRLQRVERVPLLQTMDIVRQVACGLALIHAQGIVHRDLKPANIFLQPRELSGDYAKIVDFGISKVTSETRLTRAFTMVGTPECMSPEQATGMVDDVDARSDQWAFACVIWRMLGGVRPFPGNTLKDILRQIVHEPPAPLDAPADVPPEVEQVLLRALSKRQEDRFPGIVAFWEALETAAAPMRPAATMALPAVGRRRALWPFAVVALLSLAAGAVIGTAGNPRNLIQQMQPPR